MNKIGKSCSAYLISMYESLPDYLMSCLDYCAIVTKRYPVVKDKIVRLLLAESLILEIEGEIIDNTAKNIIEELIDLGVVQEKNSWHEMEVPELYSKLCLVEVDEMEFFAKAVNLPVRAVIEDDGKDIPPDFRTLQIRSLFLITADRRSSSFASTPGLSPAYLATICKLKRLLVLDLDGKLERLPEEVCNLVHLRYLGLYWSYLDELPHTLGNLQNLQTLDISGCGQLMDELPMQVLNIQQLRHLIMSKTINDREIRVSSGIRTLKNLHTLDGVYAGGGIANELGSLTQLQRLSVRRVSEDHASELFAAITKMENLVSLSLQAEGHRRSLLPELESFSPPTFIQGLTLLGGLVEIPIWLASMDNLTMLSLCYSNLLENPTPALQYLPKLKLLYIGDAYKVKCIGKEFCKAGGFPKLETLVFSSERFLVEWTEIVNGAFPSLRHLEFHNCMNLSFLPEGLQNISTLEELILFNTHKDLRRRLLGEENYKIKHISEVKIWPR
ncbi:hypothetical protein JCGZ_12050 [Jatropha curcas]|uniref:Disease resistance R13L4/SHOC-2-like LRR domain-containing protein n=2 Tax=Jatropha curcas TaxID=180498 RepID=A0A067KCP5_JATCU|nr:hypothetical protein JCGZ_12050 [Jatropha curcas]